MAMSKGDVWALTVEALLSKIAEESAELIQAVMKHAAHGPTPYADGVQYNNVRDANTEFAQLQRLMYEYQDRFGEDAEPLP